MEMSTNSPLNSPDEFLSVPPTPSGSYWVEWKIIINDTNAWKWYSPNKYIEQNGYPENPTNVFRGVNQCYVFPLNQFGYQPSVRLQYIPYPDIQGFSSIQLFNDTNNNNAVTLFVGCGAFNTVTNLAQWYNPAWTQNFNVAPGSPVVIDWDTKQSAISSTNSGGGYDISALFYLQYPSHLTIP